MTDDHLWHYRARLVRVIDADTFEIEIDTGFHSRHIERVRLNGVNAPERNTQEGQNATEWVREWMHTYFADHTWGLRVRTKQVEGRHGVLQDMSLGRYVADIYNLDGESLADSLVSGGMAVRV